jgi:hypothetical protein
MMAQDLHHLMLNKKKIYINIYLASASKLAKDFWAGQ